MVVVNRRPGEIIVIQLPTGKLIEVAVVSLGPDQVRLGVDAPKGVSVLPAELLGGCARRKQKSQRPGPSGRWLSRSTQWVNRALEANHVWSYDFAFDQTDDGCQLKCLKVVDELTREGLAIEVEQRSWACQHATSHSLTR
jgi:carbon storage regulator CsrA